MTNTNLISAIFQFAKKDELAVVTWVFKGRRIIKNVQRENTFDVIVEIGRNLKFNYETSMKSNVSNSLYFIKQSK